MTGNVLFLMSDEHSREIAGCYGNPIVRTPNLDALAARGVVFENAYCNPGSACHRAQASRPGTTSTASATGMARPFRPGKPASAPGRFRGGPSNEQPGFNSRPGAR